MSLVSKDMRILIVGGGFAGITHAIVLSRLGFTNVTLVERGDAFRQVGFPIALAGTGRHVLQNIVGVTSIADTADTRYVRSLQIRSAVTHSILKEFSIDWEGEAHDTLLIRREFLLQKLIEKLEASSARVRFQTTIEAITPQPDAVAVRLNGEEESFDIVVDASGVNSTIREQLSGPKDHRRDVYMWFIRGTLPYEQNKVTSAVTGGFGSVYFDAGSEAGVVLFTKTAKRLHDRIRDMSLDERKEFLIAAIRERGAAESFVQMVEAADALPGRSEYDIRLKRPYTERVAFIGDAAHGQSPYTGMGTTLALEDGVVLADALRTAADGSLEPHDALRRYSRLRRRRVSKAQKVSRDYDRDMIEWPLFWHCIGRFYVQYSPRFLQVWLGHKLYLNDAVIAYLQEFEKRYQEELS